MPTAGILVRSFLAPLLSSYASSAFCGLSLPFQQWEGLCGLQHSRSAMCFPVPSHASLLHGYLSLVTIARSHIHVHFSLLAVFWLPP